MAFTYTDDVGDGATVTFPFSFTGDGTGYIRESDVHAYVDGVENFDFIFSGPNQLQFNIAPLLGAAVRIRRIMPKIRPYADFSRGNNFGQDQLNFSLLQQLYIFHEQLDGFREGDDQFEVWTDLDLNGNDLLNGDVGNFNQVFLGGQELVPSAVSVTQVETQPLSSGQTVVTFVNETTAGSFFINGPDTDNGRLNNIADYTVEHALKKLTLKESYPAGTTISIIHEEGAVVGQVLEYNSFATAAALKASSLPAGVSAKTQGYYDGWAASLEPQGAGNYDIALLTDIRAAKADGAWVPDGNVNFYTANAGNTHVAMLNFAQSLTLKQSGAKGDGVSIDYPYIASALLVASEKNGAKVLAEPGDYISNQSIIFPATRGLTLEGVGESRTSNSAYPVVINNTNATGVGIHLTASGQALKNLVQRSSGARSASALDAVSFGILFEGADIVNGEIANCLLKSVLAQGNPSHGIVSSGPNFMFEWNGIATRDNRGHGTWISAGTATGRVNAGRPGGFIINHHRTWQDGGHAILAGNDDPFGMYRLSINDADYDPRQVIDATIAVGQVVAVLHGENITTENLAYGGRVGGTPALKGLRVSGRVHRHTTPRFVGVVGPVHVYQDLTPGYIGSEDISFDGFFVTSDSTANPAIEVDSGVGTIVVISPYDDDVSTWFSAGYTAGVLITGTTYEMLAKTVKAFQLNLTGTTSAALQISRDSAECGLQVQRTGSGAATGKMIASGNKILAGTFSDNDYSLYRNSLERLQVKANTLNFVSIPTSSAGLVAGDIWNNAGVLTIV